MFWSHRGERCTFDVMVEEFGLATEPLLRLATIVRGADTARLDLAPEAAGLLAASLGLSRMYADDLEQLEAGMLLYDAFYRWCRDATGETHNWPTQPGGAMTEVEPSPPTCRSQLPGARHRLRRGGAGLAARRRALASAARPGRSR